MTINKKRVDPSAIASFKIDETEITFLLRTSGQIRLPPPKDSLERHEIIQALQTVLPSSHDAWEESQQQAKKARAALDGVRPKWSV